MRSLFSLVFILLALRGSAQSFTLDELMKLRTMPANRAAKFLKSRGWHLATWETVSKKAPYLTQLQQPIAETWLFLPDTAKREQQHLFRVKVNRKFKVVNCVVKAASESESEAFYAPLKDRARFKRVGFSSAMMRSGGCSYSEWFAGEKVQIKAGGGYPFAFYTITPVKMTKAEIENALGDLY